MSHITACAHMQDGVTLPQAACLASCNGANVALSHHGAFTFEAFQREVARCTSSDGEHIIASYSRKTLQQTGDGHFSPIGGYHPGEDQVLRALPLCMALLPNRALASESCAALTRGQECANIAAACRGACKSVEDGREPSFTSAHEQTMQLTCHKH